MIIAVLALCLIAVPAVPGSASEEGTVEAAARHLSALAKEADAAALGDWVRSARIDPWLVAVRMRDDGDSKGARLLAGQVPNPDGSALRRVLESHAETPGSTAAVRHVLRAVDEAQDDAQRAELVASIDGLESSGDPLHAVLLSRARARLVRARGRMRESVEAYAQWSRGALALGWLASASQALHEKGLAARADADLSVVLRSWEDRLEVERRRKRPQGVAHASYFLGNALAEAHQSVRALAHYDEAIGLYKRQRNALGLAAVRLSASFVRARRGELLAARRDLDLVRDDLERLQAVLEKRRNPALEQAVHRILANASQRTGEIEMRQGHYDQAERHFEQARRQFARLPTSEGALGAARALGSMGAAARFREENELASERLEAALSELEALGGHEADVVKALLNLAWLYTHRGQHEDAAAREKRAHELAKRLKDPWLEARALTEHGGTLRALGRLDEALAVGRRALELAKGLGEDRTFVLAARELAETQRVRGDPGAAADVAGQGLSTLLSLLISEAGAEQGARARAGYGRLYATALDAAIAAGDEPRTLEFLEASRAGSLLEQLEGGGALRDAQVSKTLRTAENLARRGVAGARERLHAAIRSGRLRDVHSRNRDLSEALERVQKAVERIQREGRPQSAALYPRRVAEAEARSLLAPREAFVLFVLTDESAAALVLRPEAARLVDLGPPAPIRTACASAAEVVADADADASPALDRVRKLVVEPLKLAQPTERLIVCLDRELFQVPFSALLPEREIVHIASVSAYRAGSGIARDTPPGRGVLALGAPVYPKPADLVALPHTEVEVSRIGSRVLTGVRATEAGLRESLSRAERWRAMHLACHGEVNREQPSRSWLALTPAAPDDGYLTALDVYQMDIRADLVVLSACRTGLGRVFDGEGLVGLPHAFLHAGARSVLCSLWRVDDEATSALMREFYARWNPPAGRLRLTTAAALIEAQAVALMREFHGHWSPPAAKPRLTAAAALVEAQAAVRANDEWKHPYYWAAWVLWGLPR